MFTFFKVTLVTLPFDQVNSINRGHILTKTNQHVKNLKIRSGKQVYIVCNKNDHCDLELSPSEPIIKPISTLNMKAL